MACRLFHAKPLFEPVLVYLALDHWEQVSFNEIWVKLQLTFIHENVFESIVC